MTDAEDPPRDYRGWWRIVETSQWGAEHLDLLGTAMFSLTGRDDRLRMCALLAEIDCWPTKTGVSFAWRGAWEYNPVSGTGNAQLRKDGSLVGKLKIKNGDESSFVAQRTAEPKEPIPDPPSYRDKWSRRW